MLPVRITPRLAFSTPSSTGVFFARNEALKLPARRFRRFARDPQILRQNRAQYMVSDQNPSTKKSPMKQEKAVVSPFKAGRGMVQFPDDTWVPTIISGTARIAADRGIDIANLSRSYGIILGRQMLQLGIEDMIPECVIDGVHFGWQDDESPMDLMQFETLMQSILSDGKESGSSKQKSNGRTVNEMFALSQMYGFLLGTTLKMSCLELNLEYVTTGFRAACAEPDIELPLKPNEYDRQFMEMHQIASALVHDVNLADADRFFETLKLSPRAQNGNIDGTIMFIPGEYVAPDTMKMVTIHDTVMVVMVGRLLDGRSFLVPTFSRGPDKEADSVTIPLAGVPQGLSAGIVGMREGEVRLVYIHPRASDGVSALFSAQPFPPQSAIIFEVKLLLICPPVSKEENAPEANTPERDAEP